MATKRQERFFNREWSWLQFNGRVLEEAADASNPLLERVKFLAIFASNLDEFFMIRVAGLYRQQEAGIERSGTDDRSPRDQIVGIATRVHALCREQERVLAELLGSLEQEGIRLCGVESLTSGQRAYVDRYYEEVIYPVLTPTIVGPTHPFPRLQGQMLYLVLRLSDTRKRKARHRLGFVGLPRVLPRFVRLVGQSSKTGPVTLVPMESILVTKAGALFSGYEIESYNALRVTRDADIALDEEAADDLRRAIARKLLGRRHGAAVRLEHGAHLERGVLDELQQNLEVDPRQHYPCQGLLQPADLMEIGSLDRGELKDRPLTPLVFANRPRSIFDWIKRGPLLLYHPYHAFDPVAEFVAEAAQDPNVLAIKQTLYRTSGNSPVIRALTRAAEAGKQVTVVLELRARFDEERNIEWARHLEQAGAHVVYGLVGLKTHCKALLVVRREEDGIRRYVHFGTGNYNDATARIYTDMGLITDDELYGEDASALFNVITGATKPPTWNHVEMSPTGLRRRLVNLIRRETEQAANGAPGRIVAKMNSLVDRGIIDKLYEASQAGVKIELIIRGICCLVPGVKGLSENIRVLSIVGRFLEHARVFWFKNAGQDEVYLASADWMPRNLDRRIELMFPLDDPQHKAYAQRILTMQLEDTRKARQLFPNGEYRYVSSLGKPVDSQVGIYDFTRRMLNDASKLAAESVVVSLGSRA